MQPSPDATLNIFFATMLTISALVGWWRGSRSVVSGPLPVAVLLALSISATLWTPMLGDGAMIDDELIAGFVMWMPALPVLLTLVGRIAQSGRTVTALLVGMAGWLVVLDIAVIVDLMSRVGLSADPPLLAAG